MLYFLKNTYVCTKFVQKNKKHLQKNKDLTFHPKIEHSQYLPALRKAVFDVGEHLYQQSHTQSTVKKKYIAKKMINRRSEHIYNNIIQRNSRILFSILDENKTGMITVPFVSNESMSNIDSMIIKTIEKFCAKKKKRILTEKVFCHMYCKTLPKCKGRVPLNILNSGRKYM